MEKELVELFEKCDGDKNKQLNKGKCDQVLESVNFCCPKPGYC